jgi:hypothetical protein
MGNRSWLGEPADFYEFGSRRVDLNLTRRSPSWPAALEMQLYPGHTGCRTRSLHNMDGTHTGATGGSPKRDLVPGRRPE